MVLCVGSDKRGRELKPEAALKAEIAATTPIGSRVVKAQRSALAGVSPIWISRPAQVRLGLGAAMPGVSGPARVHGRGSGYDVWL